MAEKLISIGSICFQEKDKLGQGGNAVVFRGIFGKSGMFGNTKREIAVKRITLDGSQKQLETIKREVDHLIRLDNRQNVIRYHDWEVEKPFCYIAFELALGTLEDYVIGKYQGPATDNTTILHQTAKGLQCLHSNNIIHQDIKPSNILLVEEGNEVIAKLSDFGLSKQLTDSRQFTKTVSGTQGWMAAERLKTYENDHPESTAACDVFALGCLIFFVLSKGSHPYGPTAERDYHIIHDKYSLSALDDVTSRSLVEDMIQHKSKTRPSAEAVVNHPFFWATKETMSFMQEVSSLAKSCNHADLDLVQCLEKDKHLVLGGRPDKHNSWKARIGEAIDAGVDAGLSKEKEQHKQNKSTKKAYDETVAELLRFNRNKVQHFDELPAEARSIVGSTREEFVQYILRMCLVLHVWKSLFNISTECGLNNYYKAHHKFRLSSDVTPDAEENSRPSVSGPAVQDSNIEECRTRHADDLKKDSEPTSNMHLLLILHNNPDMTSLRVPASGRPWNLHIVANTCNNLTKVDLRGFDIDLQSLSKLAKQNRLLEEVTLPAGCTDEQLEALLTPLEHLRRLEVSSPNGTGRWLQRLSPSLKTLYIKGPGAPLEPERPVFSDKGLAVYVSHVTDSTLSILTGVAARLCKLYIDDCPEVTASGLLRLGSLTKLENLNLHGMSAGVPKNAEQGSPGNTGLWLQNLPPSLLRLYISGPGAPLEPERPVSSDKGLAVYVSHVTDSTLSLLTGVAERRVNLCIDDCPEVTARGLLHLGSVLRLKILTLYGGSGGVVTDAMLDSLHSCSGLKLLMLGDRRRPPETAITAAAVSRLMVACRKLDELYLHITADCSQAVLTALWQTDLGRDRYGGLRVIDLLVPGPVFSQLRWPDGGPVISGRDGRRWTPSGNAIYVWEWEE